MKTCPNCHNQIPAEALFCPICGTKQIEEETTTSPSEDSSQHISESTTPENGEFYHYGFSYVVIFKIILAIVALLVGGTYFFFINHMSYGATTQSFFALLIGVGIAFLIYFCGSIFIKLFENIAIITKTSVEIRNKLYQDDQKD